MTEPITKIELVAPKQKHRARERIEKLAYDRRVLKRQLAERDRQLEEALALNAYLIERLRLLTGGSYTQVHNALSPNYVNGKGMH